MPTLLPRRLRRLALGVLVTAGLVATSACGGSTAASTAPGPAPTTEAAPGTYLALGDSVPFGFRGGLTVEYRDPAKFVGYPELVGQQLGLDVVNAACPGETTASFLDTTAQSNGCENSLNSTLGYRTYFPLHFPLHASYASPVQSQLEFAVETLERTPGVELVTLQIGANDAFLCQNTTADRCTAPAELQAVGETVQTHVDQILLRLRDDGGYTGRIVVVGYYALDYSSPTAAASMMLNNAIGQAARAHGAEVADGFAAFRSAAAASGGNSVAAGLVLPDDVHPSEQGQRLLAQAVTSVAGG